MADDSICTTSAHSSQDTNKFLTVSFRKDHDKEEGIQEEHAMMDEGKGNIQEECLPTTSGRPRGRKGRVKKASSDLCQVCGDYAAGFHCGAFVCEPCKKFYLRSLKLGIHEKFTCAKSSQCEITKDRRSNCQKCRYKKCLDLGMYVPGDERSGGLKVNFKEIACGVCGGSSSGYHFGAITCESCKGFFRRVAREVEQDKQQLPLCNNNSQCAITESTRSTCKSCRYHKCLQIGMTFKAIRMGRQPYAVKRATLMALKGNTESVHPETAIKMEPQSSPEHYAQEQMSFSTDSAVFENLQLQLENSMPEKPVSQRSNPQIACHVDSASANESMSYGKTSSSYKYSEASYSVNQKSLEDVKESGGVSTADIDINSPDLLQMLGSRFELYKTLDNDSKKQLLQTLMNEAHRHLSEIRNSPTHLTASHSLSGENYDVESDLGPHPFPSSSYSPVSNASRSITSSAESIMGGLNSVHSSSCSSVPCTYTISSNSGSVRHFYQQDSSSERIASQSADVYADRTNTCPIKKETSSIESKSPYELKRTWDMRRSDNTQSKSIEFSTGTKIYSSPGASASQNMSGVTESVLQSSQHHYKRPVWDIPQAASVADKTLPLKQMSLEEKSLKPDNCGEKSSSTAMTADMNRGLEGMPHDMRKMPAELAQMPGRPPGIPPGMPPEMPPEIAQVLMQLMANMPDVTAYNGLNGESWNDMCSNYPDNLPRTWVDLFDGFDGLHSCKTSTLDSKIKRYTSRDDSELLNVDRIAVIRDARKSVTSDSCQDIEELMNDPTLFEVSDEEFINVKTHLVKMFTTVLKDFDSIKPWPSSPDYVNANNVNSTWHICEDVLMYHSKVYAKYLNRLPGFSKLPLQDQTLLLRESIYPVTHIYYGRKHDIPNRQYNFFNMTIQEKSAILRDIKPFHVLGMHFHMVGSIIQQEKLSIEEIAVICAMLVFIPDPSLGLTSMSEVVRQRVHLTAILFKLCQGQTSSGARRFQTLMQLFPVLHWINLDHLRACLDIFKTMNLTFGDLWDEIFMYIGNVAKDSSQQQ